MVARHAGGPLPKAWVDGVAENTTALQSASYHGYLKLAQQLLDSDAEVGRAMEYRVRHGLYSSDASGPYPGIYQGWAVMSTHLFIDGLLGLLVRAQHRALRQVYQVLERAEPRVAPGWFGCFDAVRIGVALETGAAVAFMGHENISYGIDRIVAIDSDGTGYVWHQINRCGKVVFDGRRAPADCAPSPEGN